MSHSRGIGRSLGRSGGRSEVSGCWLTLAGDVLALVARLVRVRVCVEGIGVYK